jgi:transposase
MNAHSHLEPNSAVADAAPVSPQAWIGLDWGHRTHAFALLDHAGHAEAGTIQHSPESLHHWLKELAQRYGGRPVALAIEANRGAVVDGLRQYSWLIIYPVNPVTSARYRRAFTPSCAKDDLPDAHVLLDLVRHHAHKLRPLETQDPQTAKLARLVEARRHMVDRRTQLLNQLTSLLKSYYPQALELIGDLNSDLAIDFLTRWPDLISLKASRASAIKRFYCAHNLRRPELLTTRVKQIEAAVALTNEDHLIAIAVLQLRLLLDQLRAFRKHLPIVEAEIKTAFAAHPEAHLFRDLPGAGAQLAPRLCVAFGTLRHLYPDPGSLQKFAGVAPVREKSGNQLWTHWRWLAPTFLRQTFVEWAGQTVVFSAWAKVYYQRMIAKGSRHHSILRALAFRWIRILWKCWQTRTPYEESRYLQQLLRRKSPNAIPA